MSSPLHESSAVSARIGLALSIGEGLPSLPVTVSWRARTPAKPIQRADGPDFRNSLCENVSKGSSQYARYWSTGCTSKTRGGENSRLETANPSEEGFASEASFFSEGAEILFEEVSQIGGNHFLTMHVSLDLIVIA
jgi:hypothetical protein